MHGGHGVIEATYFDPLVHLKLSIEVSCFEVIEVVSNLYAELGWSPCMYSFSLQ